MKNLTHKNSHLRKKAIRLANRQPTEAATEKEFNMQESQAKDKRKKNEEALVASLDRKVKEHTSKAKSHPSKRTSVQESDEHLQSIHSHPESARWSKVKDKKTREERIIFNKHENKQSR